MKDIYTSEAVDEIFVKVQGGFKEIGDYVSRGGQIRKWSELLPVTYRETATIERIKEISYGVLTLDY